MGILLDLDQSSGEKSSLRMIESATCQAELKCAWIKAALFDLRNGWHPTDRLLLTEKDDQPSKAELHSLDQAAGATLRGYIPMHRHHSASASLPWPISRLLPAPADATAASWAADMIAEVARENGLVRLIP